MFGSICLSWWIFSCSFVYTKTVEIWTSKVRSKTPSQVKQCQHVPIPWEENRLRPWCGKNCLTNFLKQSPWKVRNAPFSEKLKNLWVPVSAWADAELVPEVIFYHAADLLWSFLRAITESWLAFPRHSLQLNDGGSALPEPGSAGTYFCWF